ncbi:MAG: Nramp family divalent metal transporter [Methylotenera sp.]|nr:Nramp family divalent metal transporter [Oligoflexia bacterium]
MTIFESLLSLPLLDKLPKTATAPFCPSEVQGSVKVPDAAPFWKKILAFAGPGLLISVGYMDPGNWATDIEAGSRYGYALLSVVLFSSACAMVLQCLSMRLGLVTRRDLAKLCREKYPTSVNHVLWIFAELAIIATDVAEVLGSALAFHLLLGVSLTTGILITALDTVIILGLKGKGFRQIEAIILGLISTIGICYFVELWWAKPQWHLVAQGFLPTLATFSGKEPVYLAIGILGATVMPHNLYLHSSIIQTRDVGTDDRGKKRALGFATLDTVVALFFAFLVNAAILILAGAAFHAVGHAPVTEIDDAYRLLEPMVGGSAASLLFGVALLASGQSSTFTGTIAGQVLMEGFLKMKIPCWKRRVITRSLALIPALLGVWVFGDHGVGKLLILSQVVLSFQLPFAIYPLIAFNRDLDLMGRFRSKALLHGTGWFLFTVISAANAWLVYQWILG